MIGLRKYLLLSACVLTFLGGYASRLTFEGNTKPVFEETPEASTGLNAIYVVYNTQGVSLSYNSDGVASQVRWYSYDERGGGYAMEISEGIVADGNKSTLMQVVPDMGYIIEDGTNRKYVWVVNYADYYLDIDEVSFGEDNDCELITLNVLGNGNEIAYYTINGQRKVLDREVSVQYSTLEWSDETSNYEQVQVDKKIEALKDVIVMQAPLCNTTFTIFGDRFLQYWNEAVSFESSVYATQAVEVKGVAVQTNAEQGAEGLGGSAPADIQFSGYVTDAVVHKEWQIASDAEFENILQRYNEQDLEYSFNEAGTFYVRFFGANASGTCESYGESFTISIGESSLRCPNAFSPDASEGVNDVWRVKYRSIISFECHIFNRWGIELFNFKDPSQGWDGKYKGKYVGPGVYFYVINAVGADGKKYNLKGDINIVGYTKSSYGTSTE